MEKRTHLTLVGTVALACSFSTTKAFKPCWLSVHRANNERARSLVLLLWAGAYQN
ncbi:hypothetical protein BCR43DRAFT_481907 [Syncephalastrum racemosum]|uniref:Uncharacterized protein n=1 Tax=Syncephalastrum racemosum TaxID=13706 RepID=A0A1X2HSZ7_SYNRA|nr:hypothetical protein BCR43DRAFT_481907 [Syncephalastrum racemosum]